MVVPSILGNKDTSLARRESGIPNFFFFAALQMVFSCELATMMLHFQIILLLEFTTVESHFHLLLASDLSQQQPVVVTMTV